MSRSRSLTPHEERLVVRHSHKLDPRDRALMITGLFTGFRVSELIALTIGHVLQDHRIVDKISLAPRYLKGGYGHTRVVPVANELRRALEAYLVRRGRKEELRPDAPLFVSRQHDAAGNPKPLGRSRAERLMKQILRQVCEDKTGLSSHCARKSFAGRVFRQSKHDILVVKEALGHAFVSTTQAYLDVCRAHVDEVIRSSDWTRRSRRPALPIGVPVKPKTVATPVTAPVTPLETATVTAVVDKPGAVSHAATSVPDYLPGFEAFAA